MKKIIFYLIILGLAITVYAGNETVFRKAGSITVATTGIDSIMVPIFTPDEWGNALRVRGTNHIRIPERDGDWGIYVYANEVSLTTTGNVDISYRIVDWNYNTEDADSTNLTASWAWKDRQFKIFNVTQSIPVPFLWIIVDRTSGDGTARFDIWTTYK